MSDRRPRHRRHPCQFGDVAQLNQPIFLGGRMLEVLTEKFSCELKCSPNDFSFTIRELAGTIYLTTLPELARYWQTLHHF